MLPCISSVHVDRRATSDRRGVVHRSGSHLLIDGERLTSWKFFRLFLWQVSFTALRFLFRVTRFVVERALLPKPLRATSRAASPVAAVSPTGEILPTLIRPFFAQSLLNRFCSLFSAIFWRFFLKTFGTTCSPPVSLTAPAAPGTPPTLYLDPEHILTSPSTFFTAYLCIRSLREFAPSGHLFYLDRVFLHLAFDDSSFFSVVTLTLSFSLEAIILGDFDLSRLLNLPSA